MSIKVITDYFTDELTQAAHIETGKKMSAYMKNHFPFYGVSAPLRKEIISRLWTTEKSVIKSEIRPLVQALWQLEHREYHMIAIALMGRCKTVFSESDLPFIESLITSKSWWDTVDFLASTIIGHILKSNEQLARQTAYRYTATSDLWLQRTALIYQLKYKDATDAALLFDLIMQSHGSKEFFINKASGWALRQYSKYNAADVSAFIENNKTKLSKLTIREGSKYL